MAVGQLQLELHRRADRTPDHVLHALHDLVDVDGFRGQRLLARKGEQAVGQGAGAGCGLDRGLDVSRGIRYPPLGQERAYQRQGACDPLQHVIEVVGDAARQLADRLQLFALTQPVLGLLVLHGLLLQGVERMLQLGGARGDPLFELFASARQEFTRAHLFVDVGRGAQPFANTVLVAMDGDATRLEPAVFARTRLPDTEAGLIHAGRAGLVPGREGALAVVGMQRVEPAATEAGFTAQPGLRDPLWTCPDPVTIIERPPDQLRDAFQQKTLVLLRCRQRRFHFFHHGNVMSHATDAFDPPFVPVHREIGVAHPAHLAVCGPADPVLEHDLLAVFDPADALDGARPVLRKNRVQPVVVVIAGQHFLAVEAVNRLERRRQVFPLQGVRIAYPEDVLRGFAEPAEQFRAVVPIELGLFDSAPGHGVARQVEQPEDGAGCISDR